MIGGGEEHELHLRRTVRQIVEKLLLVRIVVCVPVQTPVSGQVISCSGWLLLRSPQVVPASLASDACKETRGSRCLQKRAGGKEELTSRIHMAPCAE